MVGFKQFSHRGKFQGTLANILVMQNFCDNPRTIRNTTLYDISANKTIVTVIFERVFELNLANKPRARSRDSKDEPEITQEDARASREIRT